MQMPLRPHDPQIWIDQLFSAKDAQTGGVVRRNKTWVDREIGRARFEQEVRARGFHLIETTRQLVVICNQGHIRLVF